MQLDSVGPLLAVPEVVLCLDKEMGQDEREREMSDNPSLQRAVSPHLKPETPGQVSVLRAEGLQVQGLGPHPPSLLLCAPSAGVEAASGLEQRDGFHAPTP